MQIRRTSSLQNTQAIQFKSTQATSKANMQSASAPVDQLDLSAEAQMISQSQSTNDIRMDRVADLRAQIASGQYETAEKLDAAVDRLLDQLF